MPLRRARGRGSFASDDLHRQHGFLFAVARGFGAISRRHLMPGVAFDTP